MKRIAFFSILLFTLAIIALDVSSTRVKAITYGFVDSNNTYSNVGAFIVKSPTTGQIFPIRSGTMIPANLFLTASHCTIYFQQELALRGFTAYVSLDGSIPFGDLTSNKTKLLAVSQVVTNPNYNQSQSDSGDIGALILQSNVHGGTPATLPACGLLDQLAAQNGLKNAVFKGVGSGVQDGSVWGGVRVFQ